jgi:hypothetical protein
MKHLTAIAIVLLFVACDEKKADPEEDTTTTDTVEDTTEDSTIPDTTDDTVTPDTVEDVTSDTPQDTHVDIPEDSENCTTPTYPDDCSEVSYFQCGFAAACADGVIHAEWHEHVFCGDVEDIVSFTCSYTCENGCTAGDIMDWPSDGGALVDDHCTPAGSDSPDA